MPTSSDSHLTEPLGEHNEIAQSKTGERNEVGFKRGALDEQATMRPSDQWADMFNGRAAPIITDPNDGMPRPADMPASDIAPLSEDTLVCMADERTWVEMFEEEINEDPARLVIIEKSWVGSKESHYARHFWGYMRSRFDAEGVPVVRMRFEPKSVVERFGFKWARLDSADTPADKAQPTTMVAVRPIREACSRYKRQLAGADDLAGVTTIWRYCEALRTVGGAYLQVNDEAIYACELREPRDPSTEASIRAFDERKMRQGKERVYLPMFSHAPVDWLTVSNQFKREHYVIELGPGLGRIHLHTPECNDSVQAGMPKTIVLADKSWAPDDTFYVRRALSGGEGYWGEAGRGCRIARMALNDPFTLVSSTNEEIEKTAAIAKAWPDMHDSVSAEALRYWQRECGRLLEAGEDVAIIVGDARGIGMFLAAVFTWHVSSLDLKSGLDALDYVSVRASDVEDIRKTFVPSFVHRTYLSLRLRKLEEVTLQPPQQEPASKASTSQPNT